MDEKELKELLQAVRDVKQMMGGKKEAAREEQITIDFAFSSVVTIKAMHKGDIFTKDNLWVKRPGTGGIPAEKYESILGKSANYSIEDDTQLTWDMVGE